MSSNIYKILLMGPQGSGKGTQAELLSERLSIPAIGVGQLCREEAVSGSALGKEIHATTTRGILVSDKIAADLLKKRLAKPDVKQGYILDGYPRNPAQAKAFTFDQPTHVLVIEIPREESLRRLSGRLTCDRCGKVYRLDEGAKVGDACVCGGKLFQRSDDAPAAIAKRLEIYDNDTQPVIASFESQGIVKHVDGVGSVEEVQRRLLKALGV